jgi:hypothetical protein
MRIPRSLYLAVTMISAACGHAQAQATDSLMRAGARMRLFVVDTAPGSGEVRFAYPMGTFAHLRSGELALHTVRDRRNPAAVADSQRFPLARIGLAEAYAGRRRHTVHGALAGALVGGLTGFFAGSVGSPSGTYSSCSPSPSVPVCNSRHVDGSADSRNRLALTYAGVAALVGATFGHLIQTERWEMIDLKTRR